MRLLCYYSLRKWRFNCHIDRDSWAAAVLVVVLGKFEALIVAI